MEGKHALSARVRAAFEGCYEGPRAAALSGVPASTVYLWARSGIVEPSVSPTRVKLWSYADLMALRVVYWLRHPKKGPDREVAVSPMACVREALAELDDEGWTSGTTPVSSTPRRTSTSCRFAESIPGCRSSTIGSCSSRSDNARDRR